MNRNFSLAIVTLLVIAILLGYIYMWANANGSNVSSCINLCKEKLNQSISIANGPCLSEHLSDGWVCDVAHNPRQEIDNLPENQCNAFGNGSARHFVEVDENCETIRIV